MTPDEITEAIAAERERQRALWGGPHDWGRGDCSSPEVAPIVKVAVLAEEVGEVAMAVLEGPESVRDGNDNLRDELIQVAAVAIAWLELLPAPAKKDGAMAGQLDLLKANP